jgi:hypothetical protein
MKTLSELLSDGFVVIEDHEREPIEKDGKSYGVINDYLLIQTTDGKRYLTKKDSEAYVEVIYGRTEESG